MGKILIIGSSNTDMVVRTPHFPRPGETILGGEFYMNQGGKGANQAVAAARLGGDVTFVGKFGTDIFGKEALKSLGKEGIVLEYAVSVEDYPSGVALITVDSGGENTIVVAPGANGVLSSGDLSPLQGKMDLFDIVVMQLETPLDTVEFVAREAAAKGIKVILNPAPAASLPDELLNNLFLITPNETEASLITGIRVENESSAADAAEKLRGKGVKNVIVTMGPAGAFVLSDEFSGMVSAPRVVAVDTTAAGDTFNGALAVALTESKNMAEAVEFACRAASVSVTRRGAQSSIPFRKEIIN